MSDMLYSLYAATKNTKKVQALWDTLFPGIKLTVVNLEKKIEYLKKTYYNSPERCPATDAEYDLLEDYLGEIKPDSPVLKKIGAPVSKAGAKLPIPMPSLDKIKPDGTAEKWLSKHNDKEYVVSDKLDGASLELVYKTGKEVQLFSRGNGIIGQNVSYLAPHLDIPKRAGDCKLRAELMMSEDNFQNWLKEYPTARKLVATLIVRKNVHPSIKDTQVVVHDVLEPRGIPSEQLEWAKSLGFEIVWHKVFKKISVASLIKLLEERKKKNLFRIDGLVVTQNKKTPAPTENPDYAAAFKQDEDAVPANVIGIEYNLSQHSFYKPTILIEPTIVGGDTIRRVSGHNAKFIVDNGIGKGAIITIIKSGEVIPKWISTIKKVQGELPGVEGKDFEWNSTRVDAVALEKSDDIEIQKIVHFFKTIGAANISDGNITKMYNDGLDNIEKILQSSQKRFQQVPGFQESMASKVYSNIREACTNVSLPTLIDASGCFGRGIGTRKAALVQKEYPDLLTFMKQSTTKIVNQLEDIAGFSEITANQFAQGVKPFLEFYTRNKNVISIQKPPVVKTGGKFANQIIVFTGVRNKEYEKIIENEGGKVGSTVSATTTLVVVKDAKSTSEKATKASQLGIPILTIEKFKSKYNLS